MGVRQVRFQRLTPSATLPAYQTTLAAGMDLHADLPDGPVLLHGGARMVVSTGFNIEIPTGYEGQVRPRSGLAAKKGITVLNSPGTIDADYRGEISVILVNHGQSLMIEHGDRIAQLVIAPVERVEVVETQVLSETERGAKGFGSTGISAVAA